MSLNSVANELDLKGVASGPWAEGAALCFVINKKYLTPFKVLAYSMLATGSFVDLPILIISDEQAVFDDAFVKRVADVKKLVTQADKDAFQKVIASKVKDTYRLEWIAKYTFLKWLMYDDFGFNKLVYIDSDMVFTSNAEAFASRAPDADFVSCPMFPLKGPLEELLLDSSLDKVDAPYAFGSRYANFLHRFTNRQHTLSAARVNSGIQVVGPRLLRSDFREKLLDLAAARAYPNEQSVITDFFKKNSDYSISFASPAFNFKSSFFDRLALPQAISMLPSIVNLHYIGAAKPWLKAPTAKTGLSHVIWWKYALELGRNRKLFAIPKGELDILSANDGPVDDGRDDTE